MNELLSSFHLSGHNLTFHPQILKLEPHKQHQRKVLLSSFYLNGHTLVFHPQTQKLELPCTAW